MTDWSIDAMQAEWNSQWRHKKRWIIVEDADAYSVHVHTTDGVAPPSTYPTKRLAVARLLQLLGIGPVAPQDHPENVCIGRIEAQSSALSAPAAAPSGEPGAVEAVRKAAEALLKKCEDADPLQSVFPYEMEQLRQALSALAPDAASPAYVRVPRSVLEPFLNAAKAFSTQSEKAIITNDIARHRDWPNHYLTVRDLRALAAATKEPGK